MRHGRSMVVTALVATAFSAGGVLVAEDNKAELDRFQGNWKVVELVEDGHVIPLDEIPTVLPSGGRLEVIEQSIVFTSPHDGKKRAREFSIDATKYPRTIDFGRPGAVTGQGIYRFDDSRLVVCFSPPDESERPGDLSAKKGSRRTLMVLERSSAPQAAAAAAEPRPAPKETGTGTTGKLLTDAEVTGMLKGTWRYSDSYGALFLILNADGTFSTVREVQELRLFHKTFVQTPVSSGTWQVQKGDLLLQVTSSIHASRAGQRLPFTIRSISAKDVIFVDYLGRLAQATKVR